MRNLLIVSFFAVIAVLTGCDRKQAAAPPPPPEVEVVRAEKRSFRESTRVIAEVKAYSEVQLVARVEGYLTRRCFKEGETVKKGALLYEIEPEIYAAKVKAAEANLDEAHAERDNAELDFERYRTLLTQQATSKQLYDRAATQKATRVAEVKSAEAELTLAKQNLGYTKIYAPFDGVVGLSNYSEGNLVNSSSGPLATVVKVDPVRVEFVITELELLKVMKMEKKEGAKLPQISVRLFTQDGVEYPHSGAISFWDNHLNTSTGTFRFQAEFSNPERKLAPGMFARVKLTAPAERSAVMLPEIAVAVDQAGDYVYAVGDDQTVTRKNVRTGYRDNNLVEIVSGIDERSVVIRSGLQQVRPGGKVTPKFSAPASSAASTEKK